MTKRHVDYIKSYAANLVPVIPHDATMSPKSKITPDNRGKVPGQRNADGKWHGFGWSTMGSATMLLAQLWDAWKAGIGLRGGFGGVFASDIDLTVREDAERARGVAHEIFGKRLAVRRVDHPDHTKLLICLRLEGEKPPESFNLELMQSDGARGVIQCLGVGRYFNVHGTHPGRLQPYVWENDPADVPLTLVSRVEFDAFWARLGQEFKTVRVHHAHSADVGLPPERCTPEEMESLLDLIPNDETFAAYDDFIRMGSAIYGASDGADWGRVRWLAWCEQADQEQAEKPEIFWDTMLKARLGADMLRRWANERQPYEMARRAFADPPIEEVEPELVAEADEDADAAKAFLEGSCLVGGSDFYALPQPHRPMTATAFGMVHAAHERKLKRALGGDKRLSLAKMFARKSPNLVDDIVHEPGQPRFLEREGQRFLNLWSPPPRPHQGKRIDPAVIDFYRDLVQFVLGSVEETELWFKWHAWLLQNPGSAPGWHWIVQTGQGRGKDFILLPIGRAHGDDYTPISPKDLSSPYNDYAAKHLISASEMKERGRDDAYLVLKAITSGAPKISIRAPYQKRHLAANVAAFVIYSNEERPLKIDHDDRRLHVVSNFGVETRTPEYYFGALTLLNDNWAMIGEHLLTLSLTDADCALVAGKPPKSNAKTEMAEQVAERALLDIIGEIESDEPPPGYLPVATTTDLIKWLKAEELRPHEIPNQLEFPTLIYRLGARPLNPARNNPKRANPIKGARLWRIARFWTDQQGVRWDLENIPPARLAKLYHDRVMPPVSKNDFKVVNEEDEV